MAYGRLSADLSARCFGKDWRKMRQLRARESDFFLRDRDDASHDEETDSDTGQGTEGDGEGRSDEVS